MNDEADRSDAERMTREFTEIVGDLLSAQLASNECFCTVGNQIVLPGFEDFFKKERTYVHVLKYRRPGEMT